MVVTEGGAAGRHRGGHPGQMHRHDVRVALHHHGAALPGDVPFGQVQPEQHLRLLVQRGLGGVDVLGFQPVVVEKPAGTEPDNVAGGVPQRPQ